MPNTYSVHSVIETDVTTFIIPLEIGEQLIEYILVLFILKTVCCAEHYVKFPLSRLQQVQEKLYKKRRRKIWLECDENCE